MCFIGDKHWVVFISLGEALLFYPQMREILGAQETLALPLSAIYDTNIPVAGCDRGLRCRMQIHEKNSLSKKIPHVQNSVLLELIAKLLAVKKETRRYNFLNFQSSRIGLNSANKMYQPRIRYRRQDMGSKPLKWAEILPVRILRCTPFISSTQPLAKVHLAFLLHNLSSLCWLC